MVYIRVHFLLVWTTKPSVYEPDQLFNILSPIVAGRMLVNVIARPRGLSVQIQAGLMNPPVRDSSHSTFVMSPLLSGVRNAHKLARGDDFPMNSWG